MKADAGYQIYHDGLTSEGCASVIEKSDYMNKEKVVTSDNIDQLFLVV